MKSQQTLEESNQKITKEVIEDLYYDEYESSIIILHHAYLGNHGKGKKYLVVSEDENEKEYLVNEFIIKKENNEFILEDMGSMPYLSSPSLKEAKLYVTHEVQQYKKILLNEKLQKKLSGKQKEKKLKI